MPQEGLVAWFATLGIADVPLGGGKNASLGKMTRAHADAGVRVPSGFATTAAAYRAYIAGNGIEPAKRDRLAALKQGRATLQEAGEAIRRLFLDGEFPTDLAHLITGYAGRVRVKARGGRLIPVAALSAAAVESLDRRGVRRAEAKPTGEGPRPRVRASVRCDGIRTGMRMGTNATGVRQWQTTSLP